MADMNNPERTPEADTLYADADQGVEEARQQVRDAAAGPDSAQLETALDELEAALAHREAARPRASRTSDDWLLTALGAANAIDPEFHGDTEGEAGQREQEKQDGRHEQQRPASEQGGQQEPSA